MTHPRSTIVALLVLATLARAPCALRAAGHEEATLAELAWLAGAWQGGEGSTVRLEHWTAAAGGMMLGVHLDVLASGKSAYEFLRIVETAEGIVYFAAPGGRYPATPFPLVELGERRAVFANPEHDFPKRLVYWIAEDGALHAHAQGDDGQGPEWRWERRE